MTDKKFDISGFSVEEIDYFPKHSRVSGSGENPNLEASIDAKFAATAKEDKAALAAALRRAAATRQLESAGIEPTEVAINELVLAQEAKVDSRPERQLYNAPPMGKKLLPGLFILYGGPKSGKSMSIAQLYARLSEMDIDASYLIAGEPDHRSIQGWDTLQQIIMYGFKDDDVPDVLLVDSLKDALYAASKGGLTTGGVSTQFITQISSISAKLMAEGRTVIAIINPSQLKLEDDLYNVIKSNVTGVFHFRNGAIGEGTVRKWNEAGYYDRLDSRDLDILFYDKPNQKPIEVPTSYNFQDAKQVSRINSRLGTLIQKLTPRNEV